MLGVCSRSHSDINATWRFGLVKSLVGINRNIDFTSDYFLNKIFIPFLTNLSNRQQVVVISPERTFKGKLNGLSSSGLTQIQREILIKKTDRLSLYGDCSSVAERATVARVMGVRFSPIALNITKGDCIWTNKKEERK